MPKTTKTGSSYSGRTAKKVSSRPRSKLTHIAFSPRDSVLGVIVKKEMLSDNYDLQYSAVEEIIKFPKRDAINILIDLVLNTDINDIGRELILANIGMIGFHNIKNDYLNTLLIKIMKDKSESMLVRESAILALGKVGLNSENETFRKELQKIIEEKENKNIKASSIKSYIRVMGGKSENFLLSVYNRKDKPEVRKEIIIGFGINQSRRALPLITNELKTSKNRVVEIACLEALGNIGTRISTDAINVYLDKHYEDEDLLTLASIAWYAAEQNTSDIDTLLFA